MKTDTFGGQHPKNYAEMVHVMDEAGESARECYAIVSHSDEAGEYKGWSAEVLANDDGEQVFSTLGYANHGDLIADLKALGIKDIQRADD